MKKWPLILIVIIISLFLPSLAFKAAASNTDTIKIDGQFADWSSINKTSFGYYYLGNWALVTDGDQVYAYLDNGDNSSINLSLVNYTLKVGNASYYLTLSQNGTDLDVTAQDESNNWQSLGKVGTGKLVKNGDRQQLEFAVSLGKINQPDVADKVITLSNSHLGTQTATATKLAADSSSSSTDSTSSSASGVSSASNSGSASSSATDAGSLGIVIDGDFSDWDGITKSDMISGNDTDNVKEAALVADDQNVYFYVAMKPVLTGGYVDLQPSGYKLTVGGVVYYLDFNNNTAVSLQPGETKMISLGIYDPKTGSYTTLDQQAAVTSEKITQKNGDGTTTTNWVAVVECAVPFDKLSGISSTSGQIITLENTNLWTGKLTTTGGSTQPVVAAGLGLITALFGLWQLKKRKFKLSRGSK